MGFRDFQKFKNLCWLNRCGVLFITKTLYFIEYLVLSFFLTVAFWRLLFIQSALMRGGVSCWLVKSSIKVQFGGLGMVKKLMFGIIVGCLIPQIVELYLWKLVHLFPGSVIYSSLTLGFGILVNWLAVFSLGKPRWLEGFMWVRAGLKAFWYGLFNSRRCV